MLKSKRQETSNLLKSLKGFPPFRVSAIEKMNTDNKFAELKQLIINKR